MSAPPTVPIAANGLEGWSSCCGAAVTYSIALGDEPVLCCKGCWSEVLPVPLGGDRGSALGALVAAVIDGSLPADEAVERQGAILAGEDVERGRSR